MTPPTDPRAMFDQLFASEAAYVCRTLARLGIADRDVEDLAHDTFLIVYRQLPDYDRSRPIRPWLFGIAFRVALAHRRRASTRSERLDEETAAMRAPDLKPSAQEQLEVADRRATVIKALQNVHAERLAVFVLHEIDGFSMPDIIRAENIPLNTGYSRLRLARQEFEQALKRLTAHPQGEL